MSTTAKGVKPRILLRNKDYQTGSYPTLLRVGDDSRYGFASSSFDDTNTILFQTENINLPLGLPNTSVFSNSNIQTNINVSSSIRKGISDNFINIKKEDYRITPFNESFRPEQSQTSSFFLTGTNFVESSLGFTSKLASKAQIEFSYNVESLTTLSAQTSSIVYFNPKTTKFDVIGGSDALVGPGDHSNIYRINDGKLFNCFGLPMTSGTVDSNQFPIPISTTAFIGERVSDILSYKQEKSVTLNTNFSASNSHLIDIGERISNPFLIESIVLEMPISCSDGWYNDRTRAFFHTSSATQASDFGGPCVTVCLMNQLSNNKRELIASATIIPEGDSTSSLLDARNACSTPDGFVSFSTPNFIVKQTGESVVTLKFKPQICNSIIFADRIEPYQTSKNVFSSNAASVSPYGRSMDPKEISGRSFFGKEFNYIALEPNVKYSEVDLGIIEKNIRIGRVYINSYHKDSPYVIGEKDKLILAVSKTRPVAEDIVSDETILTGSHEFGLSSGELKIKLYGSLIQNNQECIDTLNQNLTSNAVHEIIGANPVVDQFDVEAKTSFSGSYIAEYFTGSMLLSGTYNTGSFFGNGYLDQRRGVRASIIGTSHTLIDRLPVFFGSSSFRVGKLGFNRGVTMFSDNERYFDTLVPRPDQISSIHGADILYDSTYNRNYFLIGRGSSYIPASWIESWDMLFPFEPRYSTVSRTTTPFRDTLSTLNLALSADIRQSSQASMYRPESINNTEGVMQGAFPSSAVLSYLSVPNNLLAKSLFSIGDGQYNEPIAINLNAGGAVHYDVLSRGFKYGILNANPERRKWKFRRDRYGQFRDMLEQAKDSKVYLEDTQAIIGSPVKVKFVDSSGSTVDPEDTFSSNVSNEATSSLPYFDDVSRNRSALPSVVSV